MLPGRNVPFHRKWVLIQEGIPNIFFAQMNIPIYWQGLENRKQIYKYSWSFQIIKYEYLNIFRLPNIIK